jgi:hypothetical protein
VTPVREGRAILPSLCIGAVQPRPACWLTRVTPDGPHPRRWATPGPHLFAIVRLDTRPGRFRELLLRGGGLTRGEIRDRSSTGGRAAAGPAGTARIGSEMVHAGGLAGPYSRVFRLTSFSSFCYKGSMGSSP